MRALTYMHTSTHARAHTHTQTHTHTHTQTHTHTHTDTHTDTQTHTHRHTHKDILSWLCKEFWAVLDPASALTRLRGHLEGSYGGVIWRGHMEGPGKLEPPLPHSHLQTHVGYMQNNRFIIPPPPDSFFFLGGGGGGGPCGSPDYLFQSASLTNTTTWLTSLHVNTYIGHT